MKIVNLYQYYRYRFYSTNIFRNCKFLVIADKALTLRSSVQYSGINLPVYEEKCIFSRSIDKVGRLGLSWNLLVFFQFLKKLAKILECISTFPLYCTDITLWWIEYLKRLSIEIETKFYLSFKYYRNCVFPDKTDVILYKNNNFFS